MNKIIRIISALALLALLAFCGFGFMATFEPIDASVQVISRVIYGLVALACLGGIVLLARPRKQGP